MTKIIYSYKHVFTKVLMLSFFLIAPVLSGEVITGQVSYAQPFKTDSAPESQTVPPLSNQDSKTTPTPSSQLPDAPGTQPRASLQPTGPIAVLDTSMGRLTCKLYTKQVPEAVANFIGLAEGSKDWTDPRTHEKIHRKSLYNGTIFHRVIADFMVQGGDPLGSGLGDPGYFFKDEFDPELNFDVPGRLAMANSGPNTNGSQFFITEVPTEHLNQLHTIFGQCDEHSILVVHSMVRVDKDRQDKPTEPIILRKVTIVRDGQSMPSPAPIATEPPPPTAK